MPAFANTFPLGATNLPTMLKELDEVEFKHTMLTGMVDVTDAVDATTDIWPYVESLVKNGQISQYVLDHSLVEKVYRTNDKSFDHILLPTNQTTTFVVLVIDVSREIVLGHHVLDIRKLYDLQ